MRTKPYCKAPWVGLSYVGTEGVKPCCEWKGNHFYGTHTEYLKSDYLKEFKETMYNDDMNPACVECIHNEEVQKQGGSRRQRFMKYDIDGGYVRLDYRAGNKCNMKCRMCGSHSSSLWEEEDIEWGSNVHGEPPHDIPRLDTSDVYDIDFTNLSKIQILGGEPSIDLEVRKFIDSIPADKSKPTVGITTNASNASKKWFDSLKRLPNVEIDLSIDGCGPVAEYQRHGFSWDRIKANIWKYKDEFNSTHVPDKEGYDRAHINLTVTALNFPILDTWWDELMDFDIQTFFGVCHMPYSSSINAIPKEYLDYQIAWLRKWISDGKAHSVNRDEAAKNAITIMEAAVYDSFCHKTFIEVNTVLDSRRGESIYNLDERFDTIMILTPDIMADEFELPFGVVGTHEG